MDPEASTPPDGPLDGPAVREMFAAATRQLERHAEVINALNVFPVPDGDTGTNMLLTMQAAMQAIPDDAPAAHEVLAAMAHGSLMGARGNSGVILSQIVRGFHVVAAEADVLGGRLLTDALREGAARAYQSVTKPVEGTMLTVARQTAEACDAKFGGADAPPADVRAAACEAAESSLARTPLLLEVLRDNGVVDSGGRGVVVILEGALSFLTGIEPPAPEETAGLAVAAAYTQGGHGEDEFGFCSEWIVERSAQDTDALRETLGSLGTSLVVAGDQELVKIHLHTEEPAEIRALLDSLGNVLAEKVDDMSAQHRTFSDSVGAAPPGKTAVVAIANGDGLIEVLRGLGATSIVQGGQTMNPSTKDILEAIQSAGLDDIVVLPNNGNIVPSARQAAELAEGMRVHVVPTTNVVQGIGAMLSFNYEAAAEENHETMTRSMGQVSAGEVTIAVRDSTVDGKPVAEGDAIAFVGKSLIASVKSVNEALTALVDVMVEDDDEANVTLYYGADITEDEAGAAVEMLSKRHADAEVEAVYGGQPHYPYLVAVE